MESTAHEEAEGHAIVRVLAVVLERLVSANSHLASSEQEETKFHALRAPAIGILQYLERIHKYASCSKECFILALVYIDRLIQRNSFLLTDLNVHRVVITAVLLAAKFFDDAYYNNAYYAKVGGVLVSEMNALEVEFLFKIDFSLRVLPEVFDKYRDELVAHSGAIAMESIASCTDEELLGQLHPGGGGVAGYENPSLMLQQQQQQQVQVPALGMTQDYIQAVAGLGAAAAQAPLLQAYPQAGLVDLSAAPGYQNPMAPVEPPPAAAATYQNPASVAVGGGHYPIQALQQSMMALASAQEMQLHQQPQQAATTQEQQQQQQVFPFPNLAHQVSVQQHPQAHPVRDPLELNLVYHNITPAAAPQDASSLAAGVSIAQQYRQLSSLHDSLTAAASQQALARVYDPAYYSAPAAPPSMEASSNLNMSAHSALNNASVHSQQMPGYSPHQLTTTDYAFNHHQGGGAAAAVPTRQQQRQTSSNLAAQLSHPEITPSPPPHRPPVVDFHGAPVIAPAMGGVGGGRGYGAPSIGHQVIVGCGPHAGGMQAVHAAPGQHQAAGHHRHHHPATSHLLQPMSGPGGVMHPGGGTGSWSRRMVSLGPGGSRESDPS